MKRYQILDVCARIEGHAVQHQMLREYCSVFQDWEGLLQRAEREGMAPLLRKHLIESESIFPVSVRRSLNILYKRHQKQAEVRLEIVSEILELFQRERLKPIIIKGTALCHTIYPDPPLRPMRDIDILFCEEEVGVAQKILKNIDFNQAESPIPPDHFHLPSLLKKVDGMTICIELHRGLYPDCPPYYPDVNFEFLLTTAKKFKIGDIEALTFNDEEMLHYLYQHAFRPPFTYELYKLINAADIISFTEINYATLDWEKIRNQYSLFYNALPLMHHISPWDFDKVPKEFISRRDQKRRLRPVPYVGWPHKRLKELKAEGKKIHRILLDTFIPSRWWIGVYYGEKTTLGRLRCLLWKHPWFVFWWRQLYLALYRT